MIPVPTPRLALAAALGSVAVLAFDPPAGLLVVNGVLAVVALVDAALAVTPGRVEVVRELPRVVTLGGDAAVTWRVANPSGRRLRVRLADELAPSLHAATRRAELRVPPHGRAVARTTIRPSRRGRFTVAALDVRVDGPLGLAARQGRRRQPAVLRVHPAFRSRAAAELRIDRARLLEVGLRSAAGRGGATEFDALREYQVDDEFRRIDWAATARSGGKAIVRTYRAERNQTVLVLLDSGRTMAGLVAGVPRLDHAMDAVMALTAVASRLGDRAGLVAFAAGVRAVVPPGHGTAQLARVTEAVYALEPELAESDYRGAFVETLARFRRRSLLVLCTELSEQALGEFLLPALPLIARSHLVVAASVRDPEVAGWASSPPADAGGAYRKAAAVAALDERRRVARRLQGMGVTVVDAEPGALAPRLADTYLRFKASGRL